MYTVKSYHESLFYKFILPVLSSILLTYIMSNKSYQGNFINVISTAKGSAVRLVNILARDFTCFQDQYFVKGRVAPIRILKRAQILVADLWACFEGKGYGQFSDIDKLTTFADYRVPQMLSILGCLVYSPPLAAAVAHKKIIVSGSQWEIQLRGESQMPNSYLLYGNLCLTSSLACSIWCVDLIKVEILRYHPGTELNTVLIDYFLWESMQELRGTSQETVNHHRTRCIWY